MAGLALNGPLNLTGAILTLNASGGKVTANGDEVLVQADSPLADPPHCSTAPPVILPPPPSPPLDELTNVWVINSFNQTVKIGAKPIVALGMAMEGGKVGGNPTWPGMVQPSGKNSGPKAVRVNQVPANVVNDQAVIFPTGAPATLSSSGQGA